jgi:hypothetical protein
VSRENVCPACGEEFPSSLGLAEHKCTFIHMQLAISDSGPNHELHVYQRASGTVVWKADAKGDAAAHAELLKEAVKSVQRGFV